MRSLPDDKDVPRGRILTLSSHNVQKYCAREAYDITWNQGPCDSSHEPLAVLCALLGAMRALVRSAGVPSSSPREHERSYPPRTSQRCCRCEDAAQHVQRRWPVSSEQTTRDGSLWTPTTIQRGRTCAREQTQDTTTSMGSRAMVAEHAPHHTLVFHGVGAYSRARWTARPLRRTGRHCKASSTISPHGSAWETCRSSCP